MKSLISNLWTNHKEAILACGVVLLLIGVIGSLGFYAGSNYTELKYLEKEEKCCKILVVVVNIPFAP